MVDPSGEGSALNKSRMGVPNIGSADEDPEVVGSLLNMQAELS